jgi:hypothetical protein
MAVAPFSYLAQIQFPPDVGAPNVQIPVSLSGQFESASTFVYKLTGVGSQAVDFGTIFPNGAKLISIEVDADPSPAAQPIVVTFNGSLTGGVEISPGGFMTVGSPKPTAAGVLSMLITHAADVCVRVRVLG